MFFRIFALLAVLCALAGPAAAYRLSGTRWTGPSATIHLQLGASSGPLMDGFTSWGASAEDALAMWNTQLAGFRFNVVRDSTATRAEGNRTSNVFFSRDVYGDAWDSGVLAVTITYAIGTSQTETDVLFNEAIAWNSYRGSLRFSSTGTAIYDFHRVALHEFGHALGLDHPDQAGQTVAALMNSRIGTLDTLTADDIQGGQAIYGAAGPTVALPAIITQPSGQTVTAGQPAAFTVVASSSVPMSYQWLKNGAAVSNATNASLAFASVTSAHAGSYTVAVTNSAGTVTSSAALLTVNPAVALPSTPTPPPPPPAPAVIAPAISVQPQGQTIAVGKPVNLSVVASGTGPLTYQWRKNGNAVGSSGSLYTMASVQPGDAGSYTVTVSNTAGAVTSSPALIAVLAPPTIAAQPANQTIPLGGRLALTVTASGTGTLTYQWTRNGQPIPGATSAHYIVESAQVTHAGTYSVSITNSAGTMTSAEIRVVIGSVPTFATHPAAQSVAAGDRLILTASASGEPGPTYQWFKNGMNVVGATNGSYVIERAELSHAGEYHVVATNPNGAAQSAKVTIAVQTLPTIAATPSSQTAAAGERVTLTVTGASASATAYQWFKDGVEISGATGATLSFPTVQPADAGSYVVRVTSPSGQLESRPTSLAVRYSRLVNLSTRAFVPAGGALVPGFYVRGTENKPLVVRAVGPTLSLFGIGTALGEASLSVIAQDSSTVVATNDNWGGGSVLDSAFARVGAFPLAANSKDAAVQDSFMPRGYSVRIEAGDAAMSGITLAEIYDAEPLRSSAQLVNVSTLGHVGTGERVLTAGFAIAGNTPKRLLIRAVGPGLAAFGVSGLLANPQFSLIPLGGSTPLAANEDWLDDATMRVAFIAAGAFELPSGSPDAALVVTLDPGAYTVVVSGTDGGSGNALVEIYDLDR